MKAIQSTFILITLTISIFYTLAAEAKDFKSATELLNKVESAYLSLTSYSDNGFVKSNPEVILFETKYVQPDLFTFIWSSKLLTTPPSITNAAIWTNGKTVYKFYSYENKIETKENLGRAIAGATGVSLGSARNITSILDLAGGFKITRIRNPILKDEKVIEKELCYHIKGKGRTDKIDFDLFISKTNYIIRKINRTSPAGTLETVYKSVKTNPEIPISEFNLKPQIDK